MKKRNTTGKTEKPFQTFQSIRCSCEVSTETSRKVVRCSIYRFFPMVGHLFQNYDTIYVRFFPRILAIIPAIRYTCVFLPRILAFFLTNAHIYVHKKVHICVTNKHVVYEVTESRRIRGTELYRQQKTPSCTTRMKSNFSLNQAWPQWPG